MIRLRALAFVLGLASAAAVPVLAATYPGHPATSPDIVAADVSARDKALADDAFEGRGPGTRNGDAAAQWIADEMKRIGLAPGNHGYYFQPVAIATLTLDPAKSAFTFHTSSGDVTPKFADDVVYWSPQYKTNDVDVKASDMVFVGYGVVSPEENWNDYAGIDVKGKTVVILINDPGFATGDTIFKGRAMTYYGRWTYKYEEAARQGAAAAIIVHETEPAAYGWQVVRNSNTGPKTWLDAPNKQMDRVPVQGWMQLDVAKDLFKRAGMDFDAMKAAANRHGFKAVPMTGESLTAHARSSITHLKTRNVVVVIPGVKHPSDFVLYTAHWDHLGVKPDVPGPDKIHNGAVDNGMGVSSILELAEAFKANKRPERSIAFIAWTLEEQGLLGSEYFSHHPLWPLNHIVGGINLDANLPEGRAHDMVVVGNGASQMEDILGDALKTEHRTITADPEPEKGMFYRSDHISLAKVGVPMLDPAGGYDLIAGGKAAGQSVRDDYRLHHYHQPSDEWKADWDLSGPVQDLIALYTVGDQLANSEQWPNWNDGNEFRAIRDKSMAAKK